MKPRSHARRALTLLALPLVVALSGCGGAGGQHAPAAVAVQGSRTAQVVIPGGDRFSPFVLVVARGTEVTFHNDDRDAHTVTSVPVGPGSFRQQIAAGASWRVTLYNAGLYRYYCSIHARYDPSTGQVEALPNADHPGQPMEGVIVVE